MVHPQIKGVIINGWNTTEQDVACHYDENGTYPMPTFFYGQGIDEQINSSAYPHAGTRQPLENGKEVYVLDVLADADKSPLFVRGCHLLGSLNWTKLCDSSQDWSHHDDDREDAVRKELPGLKLLCQPMLEQQNEEHFRKAPSGIDHTVSHRFPSVF